MSSQHGVGVTSTHGPGLTHKLLIIPNKPTETSQSQFRVERRNGAWEHCFLGEGHPDFFSSPPHPNLAPSSTLWTGMTAVSGLDGDMLGSPVAATPLPRLLPDLTLELSSHLPHQNLFAPASKAAGPLKPRGFCGGSDGKESACNAEDLAGFNPWVGKIPWKREWQPTPVFLLGKIP